MMLNWVYNNNIKYYYCYYLFEIYVKRRKKKYVESVLLVIIKILIFVIRDTCTSKCDIVSQLVLSEMFVYLARCGEIIYHQTRMRDAIKWSDYFWHVSQKKRNYETKMTFLSQLVHRAIGLQLDQQNWSKFEKKKKNLIL